MNVDNNRHIFIKIRDSSNANVKEMKANARKVFIFFIFFKRYIIKLFIYFYFFQTENNKKNKDLSVIATFSQSEENDRKKFLVDNASPSMSFKFHVSHDNLDDDKGNFKYYNVFICCFLLFEIVFVFFLNFFRCFSVNKSCVGID